MFALQDKGVRIIAVDVATENGDGLNGFGYSSPTYEDPWHEPDQAKRITEATNGRMLNGIPGTGLPTPLSKASRTSPPPSAIGSTIATRTSPSPSTRPPAN
ncbi:hypothetical protein NKH18_26860 [Streptomyces sp. M10(2022)]